jgi:hypothetical protein
MPHCAHEKFFRIDLFLLVARLFISIFLAPLTLLSSGDVIPSYPKQATVTGCLAYGDMVLC